MQKVTDPLAGIPAIVLSFFLLTWNISWGASLSCLDYFKPNTNSLKAIYSQEVKPAFSLRRPVSLGLEVEYDIHESPAILNSYHPQILSEQKWQQMSTSEKQAWIRNELDSIKLLRSLRHILAPTKFNRNSDAPDWLPSVAFLEVHGTVELNGVIKPTLKELRNYLLSLENLFGRGYFQAHGVFQRQKLSGLGGFALFDSDRSQIRTLEIGYEKHIENPRFIPGANLVHYALGPHSEASRRSILSQEKSLQSRNSIGSGGKHRLIYGAALRDDVYPNGTVGFEFRQYSSNWRKLVDELERFLALIEKDDIKKFAGYEKVDQINPFLRTQLYEPSTGLTARKVEDFFSRLKSHLLKSSPFSFVGGAEFDQRFLFPLRPWGENPVVESSLDPAQTRLRIQSATENYKKTLRHLILTSSPEEAVNPLRIAMAKWAFESHLGLTFEKYLMQQETPSDKMPWDSPQSPVSGPFAGKALQQGRESVRLLSKKQSSNLEIPLENLNFFNVRHLGSSWLATIPEGRFKKAWLVIQRYKGPKGEDWAHTMIRLDTDPGHHVILREQIVGGLGKQTTTGSLYLSIMPQKIIGHGGELRFFENVHALTFMVLSHETLVELTKNNPRGLTQRPLKLKPHEVSEILKIYLERAHVEGGYQFFNMNYRGCAATCFEVVQEAFQNRSEPGRILQALLGSLRFNAKWSLQIYRWAGWIGETEQKSQH